MLLAQPRERSLEHRAHILECTGCSRLVQSLYELDRRIEEAALVPVPEAIGDRVLLPRRGPAAWRYATAAMVTIAVSLVALMAAELVRVPDPPQTVQAVGRTHPAVVAIAEVVDEYPVLAGQVLGAAQMEQGLRRLGLSLKADKGSVHYLGKCHIEGGSDCDRIVLSAPDAHANVMLVQDYPIGDRLLVEDRQLVAFVNPAGNGAYIVVADDAEMAKRVQKLFVRG
jgi:hypothetical protein